MLWRGRLTLAAGVGLVCFLGAYAIPGQPDAEVSSRRLPHADADAQAAPGAGLPPLDALGKRSPTGRIAGASAEWQRAWSMAPAPEQILGRIPSWRPRPAALAAQLPGELRLVESVALDPSGGDATRRLVAPLRVEYTLDAELTGFIHDVFRRGRVDLGLAVVVDPATGDLLAYAGTDEQRLPPGRAYPAASLVKVVTVAAALAEDPRADRRICRFSGSPYRLTPSRLTPPPVGTEVSLERALATSNNQCFAQIAVRDLGAESLLDSIRRFGLLEIPAPGHEAGRAAEPGDDRYLLGQMGCGLAGLSITALHAAQIAAALADGTLPESRWVARVSDAGGRELVLPPRGPERVVLDAEVARRVREMMVATTVSGTARSAFRRYARPLLARVPVAAKTGSLSGQHPPGRYEWFIAAAPAERPRVALAVLVVQGRRWHVSGSQVGAQDRKSVV